jgi:16S rRNA (uracil1498-N3)-methyltransferase
MSKIRIYIEPEKVGDFIKIIDMGTVHKLKHVLRLTEGDEVFIFDGAGREYTAAIKYLQNDSITLRLGELSRAQESLAVKVDLIFPLTKEEKVDLILQKCTELGVNAFYPFIANRGLKIHPSDSKFTRWNNIVIEAARQSERLWLPTLHEPKSLDAIVAQNYDKKIFADFSGASFRGQLTKDCKSLLLAVGPEGDFSDSEKEYLTSCGFSAANIGKNILRLETAAIFFTGLATYFLQE